MSVGSRIKEARMRIGLTQEQLAAALGVSKGAIGNYESEATYPKTEVLYRLFDILKCDANYLYQDDMKIVSGFKTTLPEQDMLKKYRALDDYGQKAVHSLIEIEYTRYLNQQRENEQPVSPRKTLTIRRYDNPAAAGVPLFAESDYEEIEYPAELVPVGTSYAVGISGRSMEPDIPDGCTAWIERTERINNGDIVIAWLDGEGTVCKRALLDPTGNIRMLKSTNPSGSYPNYSGEQLTDLRIYGRVLGYTTE